LTGLRAGVKVGGVSCSLTRTLVLAASATVAALAVAVAPASATSLQNQNGQAYTGVLNTNLVGGVLLETDIGNVTCNQSPITAQITNAGSPGAPAAGSISAIDFRNNNNHFCPDTFALVTHEDFEATVPWGISVSWLSDNTSGARNGTLTLTNAVMLVETSEGDCLYRGDSGNTGGTTNELRADFYNPDNTGVGFTEIRFVDQPSELVSGDPNCSFVPDSELTVTYYLSGQGGTDLQVRNPPAPPVSNPPSVTPASGVAAKAKKCKRKKGKKGAVTAKKKCKRKK
jgi:hypothetical protein